MDSLRTTFPGMAVGLRSCIQCTPQRAKRFHLYHFALATSLDRISAQWGWRQLDGSEGVMEQMPNQLV